MTRKEIERDLAELNKIRAQHVVNIQAVDGAIQYLTIKLAALKPVETTKPA